jgi:hypothetical protein
MKKLVLLPVLSALILFVSCSKTESTDTASDLTSSNKMVSTGDWTVTQYLDSGKDETSDYSGFRFQFNQDGTFIAISTAVSFSGTWSLSQGSSSGSSPDDDSNRLNITITGSKLMDDVSKKWLVVKITENEIWLSDDNVTSNEHLRFGR